MSESHETSAELAKLEKIIQQQLHSMNEQLEQVKEQTAALEKIKPQPKKNVVKFPAPEAQQENAQPAGRRSLVTSATSDLNETQQRALAELEQRYCSKTAQSKTLTQQWRKRLADNRTVAGFNMLWKEMVYQIVAQGSKGSKITDVDGNEYVDTTLCFGANFLGHAPAFVVDAVKKQLDTGYEVGQQNMLVGEVCDLICELTGNERVTFAHSGCEAVQYAIRIARAATGKETIVIFENDIHGRGDSVLARTIQNRDSLKSIPAAAGISAEAVKDTLVLKYGTPESLEIIRKNIDNIAAVVAEPVRTRNPDLQPIDYLKEIRALTEANGSLLVFDEVVMGFRVAPGGAQQLFDIRADLAIYGKTVGGGMPIGVVAGKAEFIDIIDGGMWQFGDDSIPEVGMTVAGGTMIKHPVSMAASLALLRHVKSEGQALYDAINAKTKRLVDALNNHFEQKNYPVHVENFASYYLPKFTGGKKFEGLFYIYLRSIGVHIYMDYPCFISTAHSDADIDFMISSFKEAADWMQANDLLGD